MSRPEVPIPYTAIVPAAGLGTRFLPATKTVPKELLPVVDTPGIELVAEEAAAAGAERLVIVTSGGRFLGDQLDAGRVDHGQQLLGHRLGRRQETGAQTGRGDDRRVRDRNFWS